MYNSYCFTVGCILLGISVLFIVSVLHMCSIYVPYGCSICPVAQPDAGYSTGCPVASPTKFKCATARLRNGTGRFKSARLLNGAGMYLPGCPTTQAVGSFSSRYLRVVQHLNKYIPGSCDFELYTN